MLYEVTIVRTGNICVEADNPERAMKIANTKPEESISWCDDWEVTDCIENEG